MRDPIPVQKYRKKPVEVDAVQLTDEADFVAIAEWCGGQLGHGVYDGRFDTLIFLVTLEGTMAADPGDWIIRGVKGEFYACKPDIFAMTYEGVEDAACTVPSGDGRDGE